MTQQFEDLFSSEMMKSERLRAIIVSNVMFGIALCFLIFTSIFRHSFVETLYQRVHGIPAVTLLSFSFFCLGVYEFIFARVLHFFIKKNKRFPTLSRYINAFIEVTFFTAVIFFLSNKNALGYEALITPHVLIYFILIAMSAFRLRFKLCLFTGTVAALEYLVICYVVTQTTSAPSCVILLTSQGFHFARASIILLSGLITGLVTLQINRQILVSLHTMEERNEIVNIFGQHVSPSVVNKLLAQKGILSSETRYVCMMFLDIRNFTAFSSVRKPQEIVDYLNLLFDFMIEIINKNGGIINKFLGDGFMAVFGAPFSDKLDCLNASTAAIEILRRLNEESTKGNIPNTKIGIGMHAGEAITGHVGSSKHREYTIIGDVVNLASRIEQLNKRFESSILLSGVVWQSIKDAGFRAEDLGLIEIRGYQELMQIYKLA